MNKRNDTAASEKLFRELEELRTLRIGWEQREAAYQTENGKLREGLIQYAEAVERLKAQLSSGAGGEDSGQIAALQEQVAQLTGQLAEAQASGQDNSQALAQENQHLRDAYQQLHTQAKALQQQVEQGAPDDALTEENQKLRAAYTQLQQQAQAIQQQAQSIQSQNADLRQQLEQAVKASGTAVEQEALARENLELQQALQLVRKELAASREDAISQAAAAAAETQAARAARDTAQAEAQRLREQLTEHENLRTAQNNEALSMVGHAEQLARQIVADAQASSQQILREARNRLNAARQAGETLNSSFQRVASMAQEADAAMQAALRDMQQATQGLIASEK